MEKPKLKAVAEVKLENGNPKLESLGLKLKLPKYSLAVERGQKKDVELKVEIDL